MNLAELAAKAFTVVASKLRRGGQSLRTQPHPRHPTVRTGPPPPIQPLPPTPPIRRQAPVVDPQYAELVRMGHSFATTPATGEKAIEDLASMLGLADRLMHSPNLTKQQRQTVEMIDAMLHRWAESPLNKISDAKAEEENEYFDDVRQMGRADIINWPDEYKDYYHTPIRTPGSSNVYSFDWLEDEPTIGFSGQRLRRPGSNDKGTLIVTFKEWEPGSNERPDQPGATYAYSGVPRTKWQAFLAATSPSSAGYAVWDYLRVRGTISGHQHPYRLLSVAGEYVPRKATARGFKQRMLLSPRSDQQVAWRRSTLEPAPLSRFGVELPNEQTKSYAGWRQTANAVNRSRGRPVANPGTPNRGTPNRGQPNNGRR